MKLQWQSYELRHFYVIGKLVQQIEDELHDFFYSESDSNQSLRILSYINRARLCAKDLERELKSLETHVQHGEKQYGEKIDSRALPEEKDT